MTPATYILIGLAILNLVFIIYQALVAKATDKDAVDALREAKAATKEAQAATATANRAQEIAKGTDKRSMEAYRTLYAVADKLGYVIVEDFETDTLTVEKKKNPVKQKKAELKKAIKQHKAKKATK